ncbi:MAG: DUF1924 domain-containing protein [Betaproteobacteria bacterium]|nr:DUF1924 domain-containing protein [Betaproteobacteria bacterium]
MRRRATTACGWALLLLGSSGPLWAETPQQLLAGFEADARATQPGFAGFSAQRGQTLFNNPHGAEWSCASCHTADPRDDGKHAKTGKRIAPMAPVANAERFTDAAKVAKWFKRNCNDVLGRACTATEKGDVLTYLLAFKK